MSSRWVSELLRSLGVASVKALMPKTAGTMAIGVNDGNLKEF